MRSLAFFFLPLVAWASPESPGWQALLHFDGGVSNVRAGSSFFLSPTGHRDAGAEWQATLELFARDPEAPCRYPARALFMGKSPAGEGPLCDRWEKWKKALSAEGIELVFAAAFLNSPSSMYGHTLLKFPRSDKRGELLDYTLNYGADTGTAAGLPYVWLGLTGGFNGYYATAPFYLKVKEYNYVENRDFWVYPLKVTDQELALLVAHAWELREVEFPYYFLRKNCSYYLLEFLEVARPGQGLVDAFPFWAVPMDTIRRLDAKGWLGEPRLRPSRHKELDARKRVFSAEEAALVEALAEGKPVSLPADNGALLADTAYELWRYRTEGKPKDAAAERELLRVRGEARGGEKPPLPPELPPHLGHPTNRLSLAYGRSPHGGVGELGYRGTLHDLLSHPLGFEPNSELSMGDLLLRVQDSRFFVERFDLLRLRSLAPYERWFPRTAWSFRVGMARAKEFPCKAWRCSYGFLQGGAGLSFRLGPVLAFTLLELDAEAGGVFEPDYRSAFGPTAGLFLNLWPGARALVEGEWRLRLLGEKRQRRGARIGLNQDLSRHWELRLEGTVVRSYRESLVRINYYF